jgi:hypothetical protein
MCHEPHPRAAPHQPFRRRSGRAGRALVAFGAAPAFAVGHPEPGGSGGAPVILNPVPTPRVPLGHVAGPVLGLSRTGYPASSHVHTVVIGGMPGGQIALIAAAAAPLAAILAITVDRLRAAAVPRFS